MKTLLLLFLLTASSLNAQILFRTPDPLEKAAIHHSMLAIYTNQLLLAGLFNNEEEAKAAALAEEQNTPDQIFYLLTTEDNTTQLGYLVYSLTDHTAYLDAIYLEEPHQGHGLGKQVLHHFESLLLDSKITQIKLYVFDHNKRALALYNKLGYEIETTYYLNNNPIGHHMTKSFPS